MHGLGGGWWQEEEDAACPLELGKGGHPPETTGPFLLNMGGQLHNPTYESFPRDEEVCMVIAGRSLGHRDINTIKIQDDSLLLQACNLIPSENRGVSNGLK
jgi:hypothetical protein